MVMRTQDDDRHSFVLIIFIKTRFVVKYHHPHTYTHTHKQTKENDKNKLLEKKEYWNDGCT